jgi:hypothetical protein
MEEEVGATKGFSYKSLRSIDLEFFPSTRAQTAMETYEVDATNRVGVGQSRRWFFQVRSFELDRSGSLQVRSGLLDLPIQKNTLACWAKEKNYLVCL